MTQGSSPDVVRGATHGGVAVIRAQQLSGQPKVSNLDMMLTIEENVGEGQVTVNDCLGVEVQHAIYDLPQVLTSCSEWGSEKDCV